MSKIKAFSDQLNELKRNTVVAINNALNELNKLQEEGHDAEDLNKTFSEPAQEFIQNIIQNAVKEAVENMPQVVTAENVKELVQNAVQEAIQNAPIQVAAQSQYETFSDAANVAQLVTEMVNLPEEVKTEQVEAAINAVAQVATQLMTNELAVDTVQNAVQALSAAIEAAPEAAEVINNVINEIDVVVKNQPRTFSDSINEIIKQQKELNGDNDPGNPGEGQAPVNGDGDGEEDRKSFANLSPQLRYMLGL